MRTPPCTHGCHSVLTQRIKPQWLRKGTSLESCKAPMPVLHEHRGTQWENVPIARACPRLLTK